MLHAFASMRCVAILTIAGVAGLVAAASPMERASAATRDRGPQWDEITQSRSVGTPVMAIVSLKEQRVTIYDDEGPILRSSVSTGQTGYETPVGIYSVLQKEAEHYSNRYDDASMPFMQRITWSGVALHAGALPGYPASHGCIRLPYEFAEHLFDMTKVGMRVIVARNDVAPAAISHPFLFKPRPVRRDVPLATEMADRRPSSDANDPTKLGATGSEEPTAVFPNRSAALQALIAAKMAEADAAEKKAVAARMIVLQKFSEKARVMMALRVAETAKNRAEAQLIAAEQALSSASSPAAIHQAEEAKAKAIAELAEAQAKLEAAKADAQPKIDEAARAIEEAKAVQSAKTAAFDAAQDAERKLAPISVFISLKTQRLYVRQSFEPVFESPVTIRDPEQPIGTHIYTALDYEDGGRDLRWNAISIGGRRLDDPDRNDRRRRSQDRTAEPVSTDSTAASAALDRINIPQDAFDRVSELILPGSSLIVSDEEASRETGNATDFIVLISSEPQGGIKMRRREPDLYYDYDRRYRRPQAGSPFFWW